MPLAGILSGLAASQGLGFIWYSPLMFGPTWLKIVHPGKGPEDFKKMTGASSYMVSMAAHAALAYFLDHIFRDHMGVQSMSESLRAGLALSGIGALSEVCHVLFAKKSWTVFAIDYGFNTAVVLCISAGIGYFL